MTTEALRDDALARRFARSEFDRPVIMRAGAGTGKTAALVARIVSWCTGPGWAIEAAKHDEPARVADGVMSGIVAITFTEAAAAEMAERIAEALHELREERPVCGIPSDALHGEAATRAAFLTQAVEHMHVRTIHAYCRSLLARFPIEAGIHPEFEVDADGEATARMVRAAVEEHLSARLDSDDASILELFALGKTPADVEEAVATLAHSGVAASTLSTDAFEDQNVGQWLLATRNSITDLLNAAGTAFDPIKRGNAPKLMVGLEALRDSLTVDCPLSLAQARMEEEVPSNLLKHLAKAWARGDAGKAETEALQGCSASFADRATEVWHRLVCLSGADQRGYEICLRIVQPILQDVQARMRAEGVVVFSELLKRAARVLGNPGVAAAVQSGITQLCVDEFQDTDGVQCDLIRNLALRGPVDRRPGLFLVGDPKQSIYGWRSADLRAYEAFIGEVIEAGGVEHGMVQNFRSTAPILAEVDALMAGLMQPKPGIQPAYESLVAARGVGEEPSPVSLWVSWDAAAGAPAPDTSVVRGREVEAHALAADILRLRSAGQDLDEVGVLFRSTTDLEVYQRALRAVGIPYEVTRDRNYYRRREVVEAAAMLRALLDPLDTLGFLGFIRSSMVGVPAHALIPLWIQGVPGLWADLHEPETLKPLLDAAEAAQRMTPDNLSKRDDGASDDWLARFQRAVTLVQELRHAFDGTPFDEWVWNVRALLLPDVHASTQYQNEYRVANLEAFFRGVVDQMDQSFGDTARLLCSLREAVAQQQEAEEARPLDADGVVKLMTIHKAKGLAFQHTYVMDLHHGLRTSTRPTGTTVDAQAGVQLMGIWPLGYELLWHRADVVAKAERIRLVYVAMTRARDRLVLAGTWPVAMRGPGRARALTDLWSERSPPLPNFAKLAENLDSTGRVTHGPVEVVFPAVAMGKPTPPQAGGSAPIKRRESVESAVLESALVRMGRPLTQGPSQQGDFDGPDDGAAKSSLRSEDARLLGTIVHWMFEHFPRNCAVDKSSLPDLFERAARLVSPGKPLSAELRERADALIRALRNGRLINRFEEVEVIGVEVPMTLRSSGVEGPVVAWVGTIDLIFRDPDSNRLVVADFKTTSVNGGDPEAIAARYRGQGDAYTEALRSALNLADRPVFEVWFVEIDDWVALPVA